MRQKEIAAKENGVSNCLILCPPWKSRVERGSVLDCAKKKAVHSWLAPLLVDRAAVLGSSPTPCKGLHKYLSVESASQPSMLRQRYLAGKL